MDFSEVGAYMDYLALNKVVKFTPAAKGAACAGQR